MLLGLSLLPFLPASNLLFYVGTFIGERLMYMPSVGFSLLMGESLATLLVRVICLIDPVYLIQIRGIGIIFPPQGWIDEWRRSPEASSKNIAKSGFFTAMRGLGWMVLMISCLGMLVAYGAKTYRRNWDWLSEEALFLSAQEVRCGFRGGRRLKQTLHGSD